MYRFPNATLSFLNPFECRFPAPGEALAVVPLYKALGGGWSLEENKLAEASAVIPAR